MTIRAVLLDAGNTLLEIDYAYVARAIRMAGGDADADEVRRAERHARLRLDPRLRAGFVEGQDVRSLYFGLVMDELGSPPREPDRVLEAIAARGQLWSVADPDARPTLDELVRRGRRVGVVSNSDGRVEATLAAVDLREPLEVVVDSGVVGIEKPDPRIFRVALDAMAVPPEDAVYVGDMPAVDRTGAAAAGIRFVLVDPLGLWPPEIESPRVRRLAELPDLLDRLDGEAAPGSGGTRPR